MIRVSLWIGEQQCMQMDFWQFSGMLTCVTPGKLSEIHFHAWLFLNSRGKVLKSIKSRGQICPILLRRKRTFPRGLENNHTCKWISDNFPGMLTYVLFLESCQKSICMPGCSPIHGERSFFLLKSMGQICPLNLILLRTFPCGLENNHACKWTSDNFPGITHMSAFLENCQKAICMHGCSPIHKERS